jgi:hypothetical protein
MYHVLHARWIIYINYSLKSCHEAKEEGEILQFLDGGVNDIRPNTAPSITISAGVVRDEFPKLSVQISAAGEPAIPRARLQILGQDYMPGTQNLLLTLSH